MAQIFVNDKVLVDILVTVRKLTNWILDSGETCHMTPEVSGLSQVH